MQSFQNISDYLPTTIKIPTGNHYTQVGSIPIAQQSTNDIIGNCLLISNIYNTGTGLEKYINHRIILYVKSYLPFDTIEFTYNYYTLDSPSIFPLGIFFTLSPISVEPSTFQTQNIIGSCIITSSESIGLQITIN
jgi:hypothetical protein